MTFANPHYLEPALSNLYCWRVNKQGAWDKKLFVSEGDALADAQEYCKKNLSIGKHTIHLGVTETNAVDCSGTIRRHVDHTSHGCDYHDLFIAMSLPKSKWLDTTRAIGAAIGAELTKAALWCERTQIIKVRHVNFVVTAADAGIIPDGLESLLDQIRSEYKLSAADWVKLGRLQQLLRSETELVLKQHKLPFSVRSLRIWEGNDRTKDRLHIVCDAQYDLSRFGRKLNAPLCIKSPKYDGDAGATALPCLACVDRLLRILKDSNVL